MYDIPVEYLLIAVLATTAGAVIQGSVGFGMAVVSAPILLMIDPQFIPGSVMVSAFVLTSMMLIREWHAVSKREVAISSIGRLATTIPTAFLVSQIDDRAFGILFGIAIIFVVGLSFGGFQMQLNSKNLILASAISGISNTISSVGGPPMALVYQSQEGHRIRGTLSAIFAIGSIFSMLSLAAVHEFGMRDIVLGLVLLPGIVLGFFISRYTAALVDREALRPAVLCVAALSGLAVLVRALSGES